MIVILEKSKDMIFTVENALREGNHYFVTLYFLGWLYPCKLHLRNILWVQVVYDNSTVICNGSCSRKVSIVELSSVLLLAESSFD